MVCSSKLQHYTIELLKMQISYALVSGILCLSVDLTKAKCQLRSVDSGSSLLLWSDNTGCRNYCHMVAKTALWWLCKSLGSGSLLWLLHLLPVFLFIEHGARETLRWMLKLSCHTSHFIFYLNSLVYCLLVSSCNSLMTTWYVLSAERNTIGRYVHNFSDST